MPSRSQMRLRERVGVGYDGISAQRVGQLYAPSLAAQYRAARAGHYPLPTLPSGHAPPNNTVAPAITGTPTVGSTLTCSAGTWTGNPAPSPAKFQWYRNGKPIGGATNNTYTLTSSDLGARIRCVVMRSNIYGDVYAYSNLTSAVT